MSYYDFDEDYDIFEDYDFDEDYGVKKKVYLLLFKRGL